MVPKTCMIAECNRTDLKREWCKMHYNRGLLAGEILPLPKLTLAQRLWAKVDTDGPVPAANPDLGKCWQWTGSRDTDGYGHIATKRNGKHYADSAQRVAWEVTNGEIPEGMKVDHRCHNRACVNPSHLRVVTHKQNLENREGAQRNNLTSGIRGVTWQKSLKKWRAYVRHNMVDYHLGYFTDISEAEAAAVAKRLSLFTHNDLDRLVSP